MTDFPSVDWFWRNVAVAGEDDCWPWLGSVRAIDDPYGRFHISGGAVSAHRFALLLAEGPPPRGSNLACHTCDNPICVNPKHLWWGSPKENDADCVRKGRKQAPHRRLIDRTVMLRMRADGHTIQEIARHFGVGHSSISKALYKIGHGGRIYSNQHRHPLRAHTQGSKP